ncbi:tyrosine-type recombinase/integrase [Variovorax sp. GT1P44]|uniref:tyrosine-type recombinase/integrase n=1 Tax=Variovorax sp. GT1P44 TaxID=3443742 RepID=UPI003F4660C8
MKNVSLIDVRVDGKKSFGLVGPNGERIPAFDAFATVFARSPVNTRIAYCHNLARFIDYLFEATGYFASSVLSREDLVKVLGAYGEYLLYGGLSGNELARLVHSSLPSPMVSSLTCNLMHAPVRRFLGLSESLRKQQDQLAKHGTTASVVDPLPLLPPPTMRRPSANEVSALRMHSMLAGVISGGPKLLTDAALPTLAGVTPYDEERAFPFDSAIALLNALPTWRDKALYSFCAASGCRISEALQLLWSDIDLREGTVKLVDPARRINDSSYLTLGPADRDKLAWKGRTTQATLLIEPFASVFFEALEKYVRLEYFPHGTHQFVFQHLRISLRGRPYFLSAASSRNQVFQRALISCIADPDMRRGLSVHSLRHMYGTYCLNYFPRADGSYGLPMGLVKQLMGHSKIRSTERYAKHDTDLLETELAYANAMVFELGSGKTLNQMKRDALQAKLSRVQQAIEDDAAALLIAAQGPE